MNYKVKLLKNWIEYREFNLTGTDSIEDTIRHLDHTIGIHAKEDDVFTAKISFDWSSENSKEHDTKFYTLDAITTRGSKWENY